MNILAHYLRISEFLLDSSVMILKRRQKYFSHSADLLPSSKSTSKLV